MSCARFIVASLLILLSVSVSAQSSVEKQGEMRAVGATKNRSGADYGGMIANPKGTTAPPIYNDKYSDTELKEFEERMQEREWSSEDTAWKRATALDTADAYEKYIARYPGGEHRSQASKRMIDIQVKNILEGAHQNMPGMKHVAPNDDSPTSTVTVENCTDYILTVMFSGDESQNIYIAPGRTSSIILTNGEYKIAAFVDKPSVKPFAGVGELEGGGYEVSFYVVSGAYDPSYGNGWIHR